jgi:transposase-like protein
VPKLAACMDEAETDALAFMSFAKDHRPKIHSINPLERLNGEIKRRTDVSSASSQRRCDHAPHCHRRAAARTKR